MPTAPKSGITGQSMIPLVNVDENLCALTSPCPPHKAFHWVTPRVGNKRLSLMKARECPLLSLVTTAICTCTALKGRNGKYSTQGGDTPHVTQILGGIKCSPESGLEQHSSFPGCTSALLHFYVIFALWQGQPEVWCWELCWWWWLVSPQPWQGVKTWAFFNLQETGFFVMAVAWKTSSY